MDRLRGSCLCGTVAYAVPDEFETAFNCHCSNCRRTTGSAFKPMAVIPSSKLSLTQGADELLIYGEPPGSHDVHCRHCGSLLYSHIAETGNCHLAMGTLIDAPSIKPQFHIFVGSKASWYEITDTLPQFNEFPG